MKQNLPVTNKENDYDPRITVGYIMNLSKAGLLKDIHKVHSKG